MLLKNSKKPLIFSICLFSTLCESLKGQEAFRSFEVEESFSGEAELSPDEIGELPLDINQLTRSQLALLGILTPNQQSEFFRYRENYGPFLSLYELQAIPDLDQETIVQVLPFLTCPDPGLFESVPLSTLPLSSETQWSFSSRRESGAPDSDHWGGSPLQWQLRFRNQKQGKYAIGLQMEKDAGEKFRHRPDYIAGFVVLEQPLRFIPKLILGDYRVSWGQGLILSQGFQGYGGAVDQNRGTGGIKGHTGMDEYLFFRGMSLEARLGSHLNTQVFFSMRKLDATYGESADDLWAKTLKKDGLHRTESDLNKKELLHAQVSGLRLIFSEGKFKAGLQGLYNHFNLPLNPDPTYYNRYYFRGRNLGNISLDHQWQFYNINIFGEWAQSGMGAGALIQGVNMSFGKTMQLSLLYRNYGLKFRSLYGNPISSNSQSGNEQGLLWNLAWTPFPSFNIALSTDLFVHKGAVYQIRGPSGGVKKQIRLEYRKRKQYLLYLLVDYRNKNSGEILPEQGFPFSLRQKEIKLRFHLEYRISPSVEYRCRLNIGKVISSATKSPLKGASFQQDLICQPNKGKIHLSARVALINTADYNIRFYNFENGLLNQFSIVPYYGKGLKSYLNVRYRGIPNTTLEAGISHQSRPSGNPDIGFSHTRISFQIKQNLSRS